MALNLSKNYKKNDMKSVLNNIKNVYIEESKKYHMFINANYIPQLSRAPLILWDIYIIPGIDP